MRNAGQHTRQPFMQSRAEHDMLLLMMILYVTLSKFLLHHPMLFGLYTVFHKKMCTSLHYHVASRAPQINQQIVTLRQTITYAIVVYSKITEYSAIICSAKLQDTIHRRQITKHLSSNNSCKSREKVNLMLQSQRGRPKISIKLVSKRTD